MKKTSQTEGNRSSSHASNKKCKNGSTAATGRREDDVKLNCDHLFELPSSFYNCCSASVHLPTTTSSTSNSSTLNTMLHSRLSNHLSEANFHCVGGMINHPSSNRRHDHGSSKESCLERTNERRFSFSSTSSIFSQEEWGTDNNRQNEDYQSNISNYKEEEDINDAHDSKESHLSLLDAKTTSQRRIKHPTKLPKCFPFKVREQLVLLSSAQLLISWT